MEVLEFGSIKSAVLPDGWVAGGEQNSGLMKMRCFYPPAHDDVEITFFQKTQGVQESEMQDFRVILNRGEHKIVEGGEELLKLTPIMGNAGNNQWSNKNRDSKGPNFRFTSGEITRIQNRPVLKVKGSFIEPQSKKAQNEYCGIFIDAGAEEHIVQQLYLQVPSQYGYFQFERYLKAFTETLFTLNWK